MITGAILGALIFGGAGLAVTSIGGEFWETVGVFVGSAMIGAGLVGGISALTELHNEPCPEGTVKVSPDNDLYEGCIPVEVAKKQVEND